jgi:RNA polymerase sigma factor for flagellar operon FliA
LRSLWLNAKRGSAAARERLILNYVSLVSFVARRLSNTLPSSVDRQDLIATGVIGLIEAIERFDVDRGVLFETYAVHRIRGAMLDELRALDWVPQSVRTKRRELDRAVAKLSPSLRRGPTDEELASEIGCEVHDIRERIGSSAKVQILPLENIPGADSGAAGPAPTLDALPEAEKDEPAVAVEQKEMRAALRQAIEELDERDRKVIVLCYLEGFTLARIGDILGVSESRVSQIRSRIFEMLRERLAEYLNEP